MRFLAALALFACLALSACGTARNRWAAQREAISLTQDGLVHLHRAGMVKDDAFLIVDPWVSAARTANWQSYFLLESSPDRAGDIMDEADDLLLKGNLLTGAAPR